MVTQQKTIIGGKEVVFESGKLAKQANGSVLVKAGGTVVMVTAVCSKEPDTFKDFFPLFVEYREKSYAAGKIPGGFFKREGRPGTNETLTARLIDRSIRPIFPDGFRNEVQVIVNILSYDSENDPTIMGINGASAALAISDIPFDGPVAGVRLGRIGGEFVVNPSQAQADESDMDLVVTGTRKDILMIEGGARELGEDVMINAIQKAQEVIAEIIDAQDAFKASCGKDKIEVQLILPDPAIREKVMGIAADKVRVANISAVKEERAAALAAVKKEVVEALGDEFDANKNAVLGILEDLEKKEVRRVIVDEKKRIDGRAMDEIRMLSSEVGVLPRTHGSALFTRGQTQSLGVVTLGTKRDEQRIEDLSGNFFKNYMLHYNFPSFSVGETGPMRGPGRREIGHGALAERALEPMLPTAENFPYTIRIVSDILESNGSSSMASVCSGCLALMDAGVPIKAPVAGIAMGLIMSEGKATVLTDIQGTEDHCGDMDFKVTGTREGITAFQMDVKCTDVTREILQEALEAARVARVKILDSMEATLNTPRADVSEFAPRIATIKIDPEKIGALIGPGGKVIRGIQDATGVDINVEDDGTVLVAAVDQAAGRRAEEMVRAITDDPEIGHVYKDCKVVRLMNFGAFVEIMPGKDGLCHISELDHKRVAKVEDVVKVGDLIDVKLIEVDNQGRINLSRKQALPKEA